MLFHHIYRNTVGALKAKSFGALSLSEKRTIVQMGPHKPVITVSYTTKGKKQATITHNPTANPMGTRTDIMISTILSVQAVN